MAVHRLVGFVSRDSAMTVASATPAEPSAAPGPPDHWDRGVFTLSLDFEMIWGTVDLFGAGNSLAPVRSSARRSSGSWIFSWNTKCRRHGVRRGICFWNVAGRKMACKLPEIVRPTHSWCRGDWFDHDPGGDEQSAPVISRGV